MAARQCAGKQVIALAYDTPYSLQEGWTATLLPAGHVLGSSQLFLAGPDGSLLYTGDYKRQAGLSCEVARFCKADVLITECTYGLPHFVFPDRSQEVARLVNFCRGALADGEVPVIQAYSLGKAQEIICLCAAAGLPLMAHGAVIKMTRICARKWPGLLVPKPYRAGTTAGHVLIVPPSVARSSMLRNIPRRRTAAVTGWGSQPGAIYRYGVDEVFVISDHADYQELLATITEVKPRRIYAVHGYTRQFAADLRRRGHDAYALGLQEQLELQIATVETLMQPPASADAKVESEIAELAAADSLAAFTALSEKLVATPSRNAKIQLIADYLATLAAAESGIAAGFLCGTANSTPEDPPLQIGWSLIRRALLQTSDLGEAEIRAISARHRDAGSCVQTVLDNRHRPASQWSLSSTAEWYESLRTARGPQAKNEFLATAFQQLPAAEAAIITRIILGDMRNGVKSGLVEEAVAKAYDQPAADVRKAAMLMGSIRQTTVLAARGNLAEARLKPGRPIKVMLAVASTNSTDAWQKITAQEPDQESFIAEDKYDGVRCQLHAFGSQCRLFSRDLKDISDTFPELRDSFAASGLDVILDGEIVVTDSPADDRSGFQMLQSRLGRTQRDFFHSQELPVRFVVFDVLWNHEQMLIDVPLAARRHQLKGLQLPSLADIVTVTSVSSCESLQQALTAALGRGREGLMLKHENSHYQPGSRGSAWVKLKAPALTLDVVVTRAEWGHGKRNGVLSDYTFAVRDNSSNQLLNIGKAYSGLTDNEIAELTNHFLDHATTTDRSGVDVTPNVILEVACDSLQRSQRHNSGLAMRFPRILAIRNDLQLQDIDTLKDAKKLL